MLVLLFASPFGDGGGMTMTVTPARRVAPSRVCLVKTLVSSLGLVNSPLGSTWAFLDLSCVVA